MEKIMAEAVHDLAPHHLPVFLPGADGSDILFTATVVMMVALVFGFGVLYFTLHALPEGGFLADTPGIRELGTWALPIEHLDQCFPELAAYREGCTFRSCSHTHEPQCAVMDAVTAGDIDPERYESYVRLREEASS